MGAIWYGKHINLGQGSQSASRITLAQLSNVIVFVGGISTEYESEHTSLVVDGFDHGDRTHINLPLIQRKFLRNPYIKRETCNIGFVKW